MVREPVASAKGLKISTSVPNLWAINICAGLWNLLLNNRKFRCLEYIAYSTLHFSFQSPRWQRRLNGTPCIGTRIQTIVMRCGSLAGRWNPWLVESACRRTSSSKAIVRPRGSRATASRASIPSIDLSLAEHVHLVSPYTFLSLFSYAGILAAVRGCASYLRLTPLCNVQIISNRRASRAFATGEHSSGPRLDSDRWHFDRWNVQSLYRFTSFTRGIDSSLEADW